MIGAVCSAPHAVACERPPVPGVIAEDAVGLGDDVPPLDIVKVGSVGFARLDVLRLELRSQLPDLGIAKRHHLVLTHKHWFGVAHLRPGDLDAALELAEDRLAIELRRLRQPVGFRDPLLSDDHESGRSRSG